MHPKITLLAAAVTLAAASSAHAQLVGRAISADGDLNLTNYTNPFDPTAGGTAFSSPGDAFAILDTTGSVPFDLVDESVAGFPADQQGIISEFDTDPFFGIVDLDNADVTDQTVSASFTFDTSSATGPLTVSFDIGAFGDFEDGVNSVNFGNTGELVADILRFSYSVDGAASVLAAEGQVQAGPDNAEITRTYTLDNGTTNTLNDPLNLLVGASEFELDEDLQTVSFVVPVAGDSLTIDLEAYFDAGGEAVAFRNLLVTGNVPEPTSLGLLGLAGLGLLRRRK